MMILVPVILAVIVLLTSLFLLQPGWITKLRSRGVPSRTEAIIGKTGVVTETVDPNVGPGRVLILGEDWAAQSKIPLQVGTLIRVTGADSIILKITPLENGGTSEKGSL